MAPLLKTIIEKDREGVVARAYAYARQAHKDQRRKTGDPYFVHVEATGETLASWHLDEATIAAGILHDTVEDTSVVLEDVEREFGKEVTFLVDGVTKLGRIKYRGTETKVENFRKMILALSEDLRVVFIKLADRLHNMKTLEALPREKQKRIALETHEIYAPLAYRLGMQHVSGELQDFAFPYLYPKEYKWLEKTALEHYEARRRYLAKIKPEVEAMLREHSITPNFIDFRAKRLSSLYQKLIRHDMDLEKIYDLIAMRIVVDTVEQCYAVLGLIHQLWPPLPGRIKDYIAMPKPNGYRSIHTTVIGPEKKIVEFQVRTKEMHDEAENGIAAHWAYRHSGGDTTRHKSALEELKWVAQLREWHEMTGNPSANPEEALESMKIDFFKDRIFVITPRGEVIDLPVGATPVDFAYHIHTEIGDTCVGARVGGRIVPLNYELRSGDMIEIITQKNKRPSEAWLSFAKTASARDHIRAAIRKKATTLVRRTPAKSEFRVIAKDRLGLLRDIAAVVSRSHINIIDASVRTQEKGGFSVYKLECEIADKDKLEKLLVKLKKIKGVREAGYQLVM